MARDRLAGIGFRVLLLGVAALLLALPVSLAWRAASVPAPLVVDTTMQDGWAVRSEPTGFPASPGDVRYSFAVSVALAAHAAALFLAGLAVVGTAISHPGRAWITALAVTLTAATWTAPLLAALAYRHEVGWGDVGGQAALSAVLAFVVFFAARYRR